MTAKMPGFEHYKKKDHISISSLTSFARCPRKFFYSSGCRLRSPDESLPMTYGSAIHAAIPYAIRGDIETAMCEFIAVWQDRDNREDRRRNSSRARVLLKNVLTLHRGHPIYTIIPPPPGGYELDESVSPDELAFAIDIGLDRPFVGKIDAVGRHTDLNTVFAVEYKTSSRLGATFLSGFDYNPQTVSYALILKMLMPDETISGTIIEALGTAITKAEVILHLALISETMMEEFIEWAQLQTTRIKQCEENQNFPKDLSACHPYSQFGSHGYRCDYCDLCRIENWTDLKNIFEVKEYDLFAPKKEEEK